jgi:iron complex outermembrane receptor protein
MKCFRRSISALLLGFCCAAFPAAAQEEASVAGADAASAIVREELPARENYEDPDYDNVPLYTAPTVTVIGVFEAETQSPTVPVSTLYGSQFNVVTEEQIERQGSLDFLDTLRDVPGVMFSKHNVLGTNTSTSLYVRGRGYNHPSLETTTYFDGVPRNGLIYGQSMADSIPVFTAGSVEVYKYPQPSRFGAGYALVNVVPKYMTREGQEYRMGFSGGMFGTIAENASVGYKKDNFDVYAAQSWISTGGHTDHSSASQQNYYLNFGLAAGENWNVRLLGNYVNAQTSQPRQKGQSPGDILQRYDTNTIFATATVNNDYGIAYGFIKFYYNNTDFYIRHESNRFDDWSKQPLTATGVKAKETLSLFKGNELVTGIDLDRFQTSNEDHNTAPGASTVISLFPDMLLFSPYLAMSHYFGAKEKFHIIPSAGIRGYIHDAWANKAAPQAGLVVGWGNTNLNLNYGFGVVYPAPAIIQSWVNSDPEYDVGDLKDSRPETVRHFEAGLTHVWPELFSLGVSGFFDDGRDRIVGSGNVPGNAASVDYFRIFGLELSGSVTPFKGFELFAGGTWLNIRARGADGVEADKMFYTPDLSVSAGFNLTLFERFRLNADYQHLGGLYGGAGLAGDTFSNPPESNKLDDVNLVNARLSCILEYKKWHIDAAEVFVSVNNVFNQKYAYYLNEEMPGISVMVGLNVTVR